MRFLSTAVLLSAASLFCAAAQAQVPVKAQQGMLVNMSGMTVYTFDNDTANSGKSVCNGPCATAWPPVQAMAGAQASGDYSLVKRDDGTQQWAYKGKPLYLFAKDAKPGDVAGDNFKNVWHVIKP
jgi:predicted lipoprotein with Yx(FWY)xxD motif